MNIKVYLILGSLIFSSCQSQDSQFVDLEKISDRFDVSAFFRDKLKKTQETISKDPKKLDKKAALDLLNQPFFEKDTLGYYSSEGRFPTELYLDSNHDWMTRNKKPTDLFGYEYRTVAWSEEKDTLAMLNKVSFPKINMTEDRNGNLAYLKVEKASKNKEDFNRIQDYVKRNCKELHIDEDEPGVTYWENNTSYYSLSKVERKEEEISSYDVKGNKDSKWVNITEISLIIYQKSYIKEMEKLNIYSPGKIFWKKPL